MNKAVVNKKGGKSVEKKRIPKKPGRKKLPDNKIRSEPIQALVKPDDKKKLNKYCQDNLISLSAYATKAILDRAKKDKIL